MKPSIRRITGGMLLLVVMLLWVIPAPSQTIDFHRLDSYLEKTLKDWKIPGFAVSIVKDDSVIFAKGYGVRELGKNDRVDAHTLFAIASNTKAFTATLLGMLVDEGKLDWDDRVTDYLKHFQMWDPYVTRDIRIRDLLTHRSGLPTFGADRLWIGNDKISREEIIARIRHIKPTAPFRTRYQYQNLMFLVAGQIVPEVTGQTWDEAVKERIFKPLGMNESNTSVRDLEHRENVATPHEVVGGKLIPISYDNMDAIAPAGAINSNAVDMVKWMRLHMNDGSFEGKQIISSRVAREMQTVQFPFRVSSFNRENFGTQFSGYGLGWSLSEYRGYKTVSHGGGLSGMISLQTLVPDLRLGVMIMTNFAPDSPTGALTYRILDMFLGEEERDWSAEYLERIEKGRKRQEKAEKELQANRVKGTKPSHPLEAYAGVYTEPVTGDIQIRMENGHLVFDYNPRYLGDLKHWHYETFRVTWRHPIFDMSHKSFLTFRLDDDGNIDGFRVTFYYPVEFTRVKETSED